MKKWSSHEVKKPDEIVHTGSFPLGGHRTYAPNRSQGTVSDYSEQPKPTMPLQRPAPSSSSQPRSPRTPSTATPSTTTPATATSSPSTPPGTSSRTFKTTNTATRPPSTAWYLTRARHTSTAPICGQTACGATRRLTSRDDLRQSGIPKRLRQRTTRGGWRCIQAETICMR